MQQVGFYSNHTPVSFLSRIKDNLSRCVSFAFSVSFIKQSGLTLLLPSIEAALRRGAKGKIITSTYQNFTDIPSLRTFCDLKRRYPSQFDAHLDYDSFLDGGFHCKGYFFEYENGQCELLIGSSNLTSFALLKNIEWDLSATSTSSEAYLQEAKREFAFLFEKSSPLDEPLIEKYSRHLENALVHWDMDFSLLEKGIKPNGMQVLALKEIRRSRQLGKKRALVIAATGSGKTYLAAFDAKDCLAKRLLFLAHKDMIIVAAKDSFRTVFGPGRTYGLYNGDIQEKEKDFVFASVSMVARHLDEFDPDGFDYIVIDEVHHAAAPTYRSIIDYFRPSFLLGLTATPDRMDGQDVYSLFDDNIPYDLSLREAIENGLIVGFRYFGISDPYLDYGSDSLPALSAQMLCEDNLGFIVEQIEGHHPKGKLMALAFCPNVSLAEQLASRFSGYGFGTAAVSGKDDTLRRMDLFSRLQQDDDPLEIVFCVDILNEGIDVPRVNMVLFLRPTESSTIFIQQLGRGLRKAPGKDSVTVLDFIGNSYRRSAFIGMALGELTPGGAVDKLYLKELVQTDFASLQLPVEIHFDELAKEEILSSIEQTNFYHIRFLKADFASLKAFLKLGSKEYPSQCDFLSADLCTDLLRYIVKYDYSYFEFLTAVGQADLPYFTPAQRDFLKRLGFFLPLVRPYEFLMLKALLEGERDLAGLEESARFPGFEKESFNHALKALLPKQGGGMEIGQGLIEEAGGRFRLAVEISDSFHLFLADELEYGLRRYERDYGYDESRLHFLGRYKTSQVFLATNNHTHFFMSGVNYVNGELVLIINLNKDQVEKEHLRYSDRFLSASCLQWESATGTTLSNQKGRRLIAAGHAHLFVRKIKKENGVDMSFLYVGQGKLTNPRVSPNQSRTLLFDILLERPIPSYYFEELEIHDG